MITNHVADDLETLQKCLQVFIAHTGTREEALAAFRSQAPRNTGVLQTVLPTARLTSVERLEIYRSMYLGRLVEAMVVDYPGVRHFLGAEDFDELVRTYVRDHPSRSYTLNRLGDNLPGFIRSSSRFGSRSFLYDLATLELAVSEVFDAPASPVLTAEQVARVEPSQWESVRLRPVAALRMLSLRYPAHRYLRALHEQDVSVEPERRDSWVAVIRRNYSCRHLELPRSGYELLESLVTGTTLGAAIDRVAGRNDADADADATSVDELARWFAEWVGAGMFQPVAQ